MRVPRSNSRRILREIKLLRHFGSHENIVQVKDIITVPPNTIDFSDVYIVRSPASGLSSSVLFLSLIAPEPR